jgi:hypothetical protein
MTATQSPEAQKRHLEALARHFADHPRWCEDSLVIRDQKGSPVPFKTYPGPAKLNAAIEKQRRAGKRVRIISVKARRVFISAGISTHIFKHTAFLPGRHSAVIAHKVDSAQEIFSYYEDFAKWYRPAGAHLGGAILLPPLAEAGQNSGRQISWANDSWIKVLAGVKDVGRGVGLHALHVSEAAYIRNLGGVVLGLLNTMGDHPDTMAFKESTANGAAGEFYEDWQSAIDPRSGSDWEPVFLAWWEHPSNTMDLSIPRDVFERSLSQEERDIRTTYGLTLEQMHWRRDAIVNKCGRSVKSFMQEYPACPEEAFLTSGRPCFNHISLSRMPVIRDPIAGMIREADTGTRKFVAFDASPDGKGPMLVYRRPERGKIYTLGADSMSGKDPNFAQGEGDSDPDYCSGTVLDTATGEQVCKVRERWTPAYWAEVIRLLGWWYNWAYLVPESNNHGQAVIDNLLRLQYPLDRIHVKRRIPGDRRPPMMNEIGFETTAVTRPQLIGALDDSINTGAIIIRDANTVAECRKFVIWPDGIPRAAAGKGNHDDDVFSLALANIGLRYAPQLTQEQLRDPKAAAKTAQMVRYGLGRQRVTAQGDDD